MKRTLFLIIFITFYVVSLQTVYASSCEKNQTCRSRFKIQDDPYDFQRESSRTHIATFLTLNFIGNRLLEQHAVKKIFGISSLTTTQRVLYNALFFTLIGIAKEFVYDPDGLSRSDIINNTIGVSLGAVLEISF